MPNIRLRRKLMLLGVAIFVLAGGAVFGWWAMGSPGDLELLRPYAAKYNYSQLLANLQARGPAPDTFSFVVFGDSRNNTFVASKVFEQAAKENPAIMFHTGDLIRGGTVAEYLENFLPLLEISGPVPVFCVPGNHERGERRDFAAYDAIYGGDRFSFDYGSCRFMGFNASEIVRVSSDDLEFLDRELSKPGVQYKFVFFHIPPAYFEEVAIGDEDPRGFTWKASAFRALLAKHKVNEVYMGHIHGYASAVIDGVRYTLSAGAGAPLSDRLPEEARIYHLLVVHVSPGGLSQELVHLVPGTLDWTRRTIY
ncbi:MAG TPA: metallophosphoesterase [Candidatus Hydrogenedentes bacterium]|nr:metallophosphoesterase [Candidatus Hydrogenedentota bacterium]HQH68418.1 metallophosphoesterase [Candidatus Hydrogenedentota bacterium]